MLLVHKEIEETVEGRAEADDQVLEDLEEVQEEEGIEDKEEAQ